MAKMGREGTIAIVLWISFKAVRSLQDVGVFLKSESIETKEWEVFS